MNVDGFERVLALLVTSQHQDRLIPLLPLEFFTTEEHRDAYEIIEHSWRTYRQVPTEPELRSALLRKWADQPLITKTAWLSMASRIYRHTTATGATLEELKEEIVRQRMTTLLGSTSLSREPVDQLVGNVRRGLDELSILTTAATARRRSGDFFSTEYLEQRAERIFANPEPRIRLGFPQLDAKAGGGHLKGELIAVAAPISTGKTFMMVNLCVNLLLQGYRCLFLNLDLPTARLESRFYARVTGRPIREEEEVHESHAAIHQWAVDNNIAPNAYRYEELEPLIYNVSFIRNLITENDEAYGERDVILIDYGDQILPDIRGDREDISLYNLYEGFRSTAKFLNKLVIVATHTNYENWDENKARTTTIKNMGGSKAKAKPMQFLVCLDQTLDEKKHEPPLVRLNIAKTSSGESSSTVPAIIDYKHSHLYEAPQTMWPEFSTFSIRTRGRNGGSRDVVGNMPVIGSSDNAYATNGPEGTW